MNDKELKRYRLEHQADNEAFYAYVDRSRAAGRTIAIDPSGPDWEAKAIAEIQRRKPEYGR
ncbi:MAG: hypothetical protein AAFY11_06310 [Cyanobacteria bacterium J06641_5]